MMRNTLQKLADNGQPASLANSFRRRRFEFFLGLLAELKKPVSILDVGGEINFWEQMGVPDGCSLTLLNLPPISPSSRLHVIEGDARDLSRFADGSFDLVFSNSVIEHVGSWTDQQRMASEVRRVGKRYFVQTPNFYFPMEPHYLLPGIQFLPTPLKALVFRTTAAGWAKRATTWDEAFREARSIRLLTRNEIRKLFPEAKLWTERFFGLTKSIVAYRW